MDIENGMLLVETYKSKRLYGICEHCDEAIYEGDEVTRIFDCECHSECFSDFVSYNKEVFIAEEMF